jgi:hypothetical protein
LQNDQSNIFCWTEGVQTWQGNKCITTSSFCSGTLQKLMSQCWLLTNIIRTKTAILKIVLGSNCTLEDGTTFRDVMKIILRE